MISRDKIFNFSALVLFTWGVFVSGLCFGRNDVLDGITNAILAVLWLTILVTEWNLRGRKIKFLENINHLTEHLIDSLEDVAKRFEAKSAKKPVVKKSKTKKASK